MKLFEVNKAEDSIGSGGISSPIGSDSTDSEKASLDIIRSEEETSESEEDLSSLEEGAEDETSEIPSNEEVQPNDEELQETIEEDEAKTTVPDDTLTVTGKAAYDKLTKAYPEALKQIPELRQLFFRDKAFTDIYPTVEDAKTASADAEFLDGLGHALNTGNVKNVLGSLSETSLQNLAEKFIPTLLETNRELFVSATGPLIANILNDAYESGESSKNEDLKRSALWMAKFLTGKPELPKRSVGRQEDPRFSAEKQKFEEEKRSFYQGQVNGFINGADKAIEQGLGRMLENNIDPEGSLTPFVKSAIIKSTIDELREFTNSDKNFVSTMGELFRRSQKAGFDQDSKSRVVSAYLGRVKDVALKIRAKKIAEARGRVKKQNIEERTPQPKQIRPIPPTRPLRNTQPSQKPKTELDIIRAR